MLSCFMPVFLYRCYHRSGTVLLNDSNGGMYSPDVCCRLVCNVFCNQLWCCCFKARVLYRDPRQTFMSIHADQLIYQTSRFFLKKSVVLIVKI